MQRPGRDLGRRMVVERSNCSRIEIVSKSNCSCNHRIRHDQQITNGLADTIEHLPRIHVRLFQERSDARSSEGVRDDASGNDWWKSWLRKGAIIRRDEDLDVCCPQRLEYTLFLSGSAPSTAITSSTIIDWNSEKEQAVGRNDGGGASAVVERTTGTSSSK